MHPSASSWRLLCRPTRARDRWTPARSPSLQRVNREREQWLTRTRAAWYNKDVIEGLHAEQTSLGSSLLHN